MRTFEVKPVIHNPSTPGIALEAGKLLSSFNACIMGTGQRKAQTEKT